MPGAYLVTLDHVGLHHVVVDELKVGVADPGREAKRRVGKEQNALHTRGGGKQRVASPALDVLLAAGEEVVNDSDLVTLGHERVDEVRANKAGAARDEDALAIKLVAQLDGGKAGEAVVGAGVGGGSIFQGANFLAQAAELQLSTELEVGGMRKVGKERTGKETGRILTLV